LNRSFPEYNAQNGSLPPGIWMPLTTNSLPATRSEILAQLRTLRTNIAAARDALMHFKDDRADRDKLEPAARRVDDLMNMYASSNRNVARGLAWMTDIQTGVEQMTNPKAAEALGEARVGIAALFAAMGSGEATAVPTRTDR
jgi:hypothetical protein